MEEIWKDIKDYEGLYQISNLGNIISFHHKKPKILHQSITHCGYKQVDLYKNKKRKKIGVHILVAQAFVLGWFKGAEVNHKDLNKTNNYVDNLEWVTRNENQKHQYALYHPDFKKYYCAKCNKELTKKVNTAKNVFIKNKEKNGPQKSN